MCIKSKSRMVFLVIIGILMIGFFLKGCSTPLDGDKKETASPLNNNSKNMKEISLPKDIDAIFDVVILADGTVRLSTTKGEKAFIYDSVDQGDSWVEVYDSTKVLEGIEDRKVVAYVSENKEVLWHSLKNNKEGELEESEYYFMRDDIVSTIVIDLPEIDKAKRVNNEEFEEVSDNLVNSIIDCEFLVDGNVLIKDENYDLYNINTENGEISKTYTNDHGYILSYILYEDSILAATNHEVISWNVETGEENEKKELKEGLNDSYVGESLPLFESSILLKQFEEQLYIFNAFGLFESSKDNIEQILILKENVGMELQQQYIWDIALWDENLLLVTVDFQTNKHALYLVDAADNETDEKMEELTVYSLRNNQNIETVISYFEIEYPNIKVNYEVGISGGDAATETDVVKTLNTEIMSGNGPDILILDDLPYESYMQKGLLTDLADLVEANNYFTNVTGQFQSSDGELLAIPSRIVLLALEGKKGIEKSSHSMKELEDYIRTVNGEGENSYTEKEFMQLAEFLYYSYVAPYMRGDEEADSKVLLEYSSCIQSLYDTCGSPNLSNDWSSNGSEADGIYTTVNYFDWVSKDKPITFDYVDFIKLLPILDKINEADNTKEYSLVGVDNRNVYIPASIVGISSGSKKSELAEAFIRFIMSDEMQRNDNITGFPNNKKALQDCLQDSKHNVQVNIDESTQLNINSYTDKETKAFISYFEELNKPVSRDQYLKEVVLEAVGRMLKDDIDPARAVDEMEEKINIYLQE